MASATLQNSDGKPLDLEVGSFVYVQDPSLKVQFFTNRTGKLFVQGLKTGTYKLELIGDAYLAVTVEVPKDAKSPFQLGTITLEPKPKEEK